MRCYRQRIRPALRLLLLSCFTIGVLASATSRTGNINLRLAHEHKIAFPVAAAGTERICCVGREGQTRRACNEEVAVGLPRRANVKCKAPG